VTCDILHTALCYVLCVIWHTNGTAGGSDEAAGSWELGAGRRRPVGGWRLEDRVSTSKGNAVTCSGVLLVRAHLLVAYCLLQLIHGLGEEGETRNPPEKKAILAERVVRSRLLCLQTPSSSGLCVEGMPVARHRAPRLSPSTACWFSVPTIPCLGPRSGGWRYGQGASGVGAV
jgi:hypothetical protein